jgi:hypothetical protein
LEKFCGFFVFGFVCCAGWLTDRRSPGWVRVNQDDLGDADQCKVVLRKALKHGKSVLLDRCNVHMKERKMFVFVDHCCTINQPTTLADALPHNTKIIGG